MRIRSAYLWACTVIACLANVELCPAQVQQAWVKRYLGVEAADNIAADMVTGSNGAVYVTGHIWVSADQQYATVKYDSVGAQLWATRFNGATNEADSPIAIKIAPDGNIVVTGGSGKADNADIATVKYSPSGAEIWSRRYDTRSGSVEQPATMTIDAEGNIYVAGSSGLSRMLADVLTLKYGGDGTLRWAARLPHPPRRTDVVAGIAVDVAGNVYLTGSSESSTSQDYFTLKYNNAGNQLWVTRYDGPIHQQDTASAILVDDDGDVYVTGSSLGRGPNKATRFEFATVKYDTSGRQLWAAREGFAETESIEVKSMSFDLAGNILVLGTIFSPGESEWVLVKYDPSGNRQWLSRYNGGEFSLDVAYGLALDTNGNTYVTATSIAGGVAGSGQWQFLTTKFDPAGNRLWIATTDADANFDYPVSIKVNEQNEVFVSGQSRYFELSGGYFTVKYVQTNAPAGTPQIVTQPARQAVLASTNVRFAVTASGAEPLRYQWRYNGRAILGATNTTLTLAAVTSEQSGYYSVEVSNDFGKVASPEAELHVLVAPTIADQPQDQFAFAGSEAVFTVAAFGSEPLHYEWLRNGSVVMAGVGATVLTLTNVQLSHAGDYSVIVSNSQGTVTSALARLTVSRQVEQTWARTYDGPANSAEEEPLIKADAFGNVYVAGTSPGAQGDSDFAILKYDSSGTRLWTARYSFASNSLEVAYALAVDATGNVWVTGTTDLPDAERDTLTVKYTPDGTFAWAARFANSNEFDAGFALAADDLGNAYTAGQSAENYLTIKYGPTGNELWAVTHSGTSNGLDTARSIAVSASGVYVTGSSWNGTNLDFLTIKYSSAGQVMWTHAYDAGATDNAVAVALDPSGNVIVAGNSYGTVNYSRYGSDYLVIKYDPNGVRQWTVRYDGVASAEDYPTALAVDSSGNIYVTGHSDFASDDSGVRQFATLKYSPAGEEMWRAWHLGREYDGSRSLEVDSGGSVYVTTTPVGPVSGRDLGFIKYDARGTRLLMARYNGFQNSDDIPSALTLGRDGAVYLAGTSSRIGLSGQDFVLVRYDQNEQPGLPVISSPPESIFVARGSTANFSVAATGEATLRYQWRRDAVEMAGETNSTLTITNAQDDDIGSYSVRVANGNGTVLSAEATLIVETPPTIFRDPQSQTAAVGSSVSFSVVALGSEPFSFQWKRKDSTTTNVLQRVWTIPSVQPHHTGEYFVEVTNRVGSVESAVARLTVTRLAQQSWVTGYEAQPGASGSSQQVIGLTTDTNGFAFLAGHSLTATSGWDYVTMKLDTNGARLWVAHYDGPGNGSDSIKDMSVDAQGNVYVTGRSSGGATGDDIATLKYDANGNRAWVARFNGLANLDDEPMAMALDDAGNVYVTGRASVDSQQGNYITLKYSPAGVLLWSASYDGDGHGQDVARDVALDAAGNVYVTGTSADLDANIGIATVKYNSLGTAVWTRRYAPTNTPYHGLRIATDSSGNAIVGGDAIESAGRGDIILLKYDANGNRVWVARHDSYHHGDDFLSDLVVDRAGNVYVAGASMHPVTSWDYTTLKFSSNGVQQWLARFDGSASGSDTAAALAIDSAGYVYVTGASQDADAVQAMTLSYDNDGNRRWQAAYSALPNLGMVGKVIAVDLSRNVYVAGDAFISSTESRFVTIKYSQTPIDAAPDITLPPANQMVVLGESATFNANATGGAPLYYVWHRDSTIVAHGVSLTNLVVTNASDASAGYYSVEVMNDEGSTRSPVAELRVNGPSRPRFAGPTLTGGVLRARIEGLGGAYRIDASTDLRTWQPIGTNWNTSNSMQFFDVPVLPQRFYRAVRLP